MVIRYYNNPSAKGVSKAAFSLTADLGFENGGGVKPFNGDSTTPAQNFISAMVYNRLWLGQSQKWAFTVGGGYINNPGRYLALVPPGNTTFTQNPGDKFAGWDASAGFQYMPNEFLTFGAEWVTRHMNVPYFAGHGGVTSPNGWNAPIGNPIGFQGDLVKDENRIIFSSIFRF